MQAPEILGPPLVKMFRNRTFDFLHQPGPGDSNRAARLDKPSEVVQVQVICPEVNE